MYVRTPVRRAFLAILVVSLAGCAAATQSAALPAQTTSWPRGAQPAITVFAAASLTDSFKEIGSAFTARTGIPVVFNFAGSQQLRAQLEQGAGADVFASANAKEMASAVSEGLVASGTDRVFVHNRLVVIYPASNTGQIAQLADLAKPGLKLVIADKSVPVGQYSLDMLGKMSKDPSFGSDFTSRVLGNVVSYEQNVKAVVSKVQLGEADAGIAYTTDVTPAATAQVNALEVPDAYNQVASYPIAALARSKHGDQASQFVTFVLSDAGQAVLVKYGFVAGGSK